MDTSTPQKIKNILHDTLKKLEPFEQCALLSYPDHYNIGDHLIWLGGIFYLTEVLKTKINYATSIEHFSEAILDNQEKNIPIVLHGGGNLGDIWLYYQKFYERLILKYCDRKIIFLPQSIHFRYPGKLKQAKEIFNNHSNLTICVRENYSYDYSLEHFNNCQIIKAPDMAFQLAGTPGLLANYRQKQSIFYHCRQDKEFNPISSSVSLDSPHFVVEDWGSFKYKNAPRASSLEGILWLFKDSWQQGAPIPTEWLSRQIWVRFHRYTSKFNDIYDPYIHQKSWKFFHNGIYSV